MNNDVKFRRNVYIILLCVLLLGITTQIARSEFVLELNHNKDILEEFDDFRNPSNANTIVLTEADLQGDMQYCLVYDSADHESIAIKDNVLEVLRYIKQPYSLTDFDKEEIVYNECHVILLAASLEQLNNDVEMLTEYVHDGGYLFQLRMDEPGEVFTQLYRKLGIVNFTYQMANWGIILDSNLLIGQKGLEIGDDFIYNDSLTVELDSQAEILAKGLTRMPLLWKQKYGSGAFMVYNGNNLGQKVNRGLIVGGISLLQPDYIYPIFNSKLFYIDDFPAPIPRGKNDSIYAEYRMDTPTFYRDIWWPEMIKVAKKYNIKYTAVAIQSYDDNVRTPFVKLGDEELHNLIAYGREVIKSGGELGIHGYNHQSFTLNEKISSHYGYNAWESVSDMEAATKEVLSYLAKAFPSYRVMSYVPPSNVLEPSGRQALMNSWPELSVISSLYDIDPDNRAYVQEYEIAEDGIVEMPRITSGYFDDPYMVWMEANAITSLGMFSHFLHPDDLIDVERNNNSSWKKLYEDFGSMLQRLDQTYPWMRSMVSNEAALDMAKVLKMDIARTYSDKSIQVKTTMDDFTQYFILRTDKKIGRQTNCFVKKIDANTYLVTADHADFTIELGR